MAFGLLMKCALTLTEWDRWQRLEWMPGLTPLTETWGVAGVLPGHHQIPRTTRRNRAKTLCLKLNLPLICPEGSWLLVVAVQVRWSKSYTAVDGPHMFLQIMLASQSIKIWQYTKQPAATHKGCVQLHHKSVVCSNGCTQTLQYNSIALQYSLLYNNWLQLHLV